MRRNTTFSAGSDVPAATLNAVQDEAAGLVAGTENPSGALDLTGVDGRYLCTPDAGVADGHYAVLDDSIDWTARALWGVFLHLESAAQRQHGASSWQFNDTSRAIALRFYRGRTGTGGLGAAAADVANGTPPVVAAGAFAVLVDEGASSADRVWLYADPDDGSLRVYNDSGATLHAEWFVNASGASITPGDAPPDIIPTLTDLLWLAPGTAAARPATPAGAALYYATDTGAVSLFDGTAWRSLSGGGSTSTVRNETTDCTAATGDIIIADASGGLITVTLPPLSAGLTVTIKRTNGAGSNVKVEPDAGGTIDGAGSLTMTVQYESATLVCDGSNWWVI